MKEDWKLYAFVAFLQKELIIIVKNRTGEIIITNQGQNRLLETLYGSVAGRILLKFLTAPAVSLLAGKFMDSPFSKPLINPFVRKSGIDITEYETEGIRSYNEFFTRKIKTGKRKIDLDKQSLISPCDAKLSAYKICSHSLFNIKGSRYSVGDLIANKTLARKFSGGFCLVFRLEVDDYHRYIYFDNGRKGPNVRIPGILHTVNPVSLRHVNIYKRNSREYTLMCTENFGDVIQVEVGAMMVGRIKNHHERYVFSRGDEKGMFLFGGSTVVLLIQKDRAVIDEDILWNTYAGYETVVKMGEKIGGVWEKNTDS